MFCFGFELSFSLCFGLAVVLPEFLEWLNLIQVSSCLLGKKKQNTTKVQEKQSQQTWWLFALSSCPDFLTLPCWEQSRLWVLSPAISGCCGKYYYFSFFFFCVYVCACACIINQNIRKIYICFLLVPGNRATLWPYGLPAKVRFNFCIAVQLN